MIFLSKVQVQEGPGLRGSHAGYTDSGGAYAQESGDKTVGALVLSGLSLAPGDGVEYVAGCSTCGGELGDRSRA